MTQSKSKQKFTFTKFQSISQDQHERRFSGQKFSFNFPPLIQRQVVGTAALAGIPRLPWKDSAISSKQPFTVTHLKKGKPQKVIGKEAYSRSFINILMEGVVDGKSVLHKNLMLMIHQLVVKLSHYRSLQKQHLSTLDMGANRLPF